MNNRQYDPQAESLKVFWDSQQERLKLLSGMPITQNVLNLTSAFGEREIAAFEKLMHIIGFILVITANAIIKKVDKESALF